jgi:error-prone DNA polymerase
VTAPARYVELHCKTNFSFLEGASHPDELVAAASKHGYAGLAVTDRTSLAGAVRAHVAAKKAGLKLVIGAEITLVDAGPVLLWAADRGGYGRLCRLLTRGRLQAPKGQCRLAFADVAEHAQGLLIGVLLQPDGEWSSGLSRWRDLFADRTYAVAELHRGPGDGRRLDRWQKAAQDARVPMIAAGDVHYHHPRRRYLQDVQTANTRRMSSSGRGLLSPLGKRAVPSSATVVLSRMAVSTSWR